MKRNTKHKGSAVLVVLGIVSVIVISFTMLGQAATQQMHSSKISREQLKARMIAESGLNKAYNEVRQDFSRLENYVLTESFGGGTYTVRSVALPGNPENRGQLVAEGIIGLGKSIVSADLERRVALIVDEDAAVNFFTMAYDLLVGGVLDITGDFGANADLVHANGNITIGGSSDVGAVRVSSAGVVSVKKKDEPEFVVLNNQTPVEVFSAALQTVIDLFIAYAQSNGAVYDNGADIPASPPGGVAFCTDASGWSGSGTGCFIFSGDVDMQGAGVDLTSVDGYPALIVLGPGEVHMNAGTVVNGAILVPSGSVRLNGHAEFNGPVLVGQGMVGNGTADLNAGDGGFTLPPDEQEVDALIVTAWHDQVPSAN